MYFYLISFLYICLKHKKKVGKFKFLLTFMAFKQRSIYLLYKDIEAKMLMFAHILSESEM